MTPAVGTLLGAYEITAKLGEGGMGEVWRATDTRLEARGGDQGAARGVHSPTRSGSRASSARRKLAAAAPPEHRLGLRARGVERVRALVMELVDGEDLSARIARGAIPLDEALAIARQIAEALEAAHERGIVHRDLKPANVKLAPDGASRSSTSAWPRRLEPGGDAPRAIRRRGSAPPSPTRRR
jgi:eukaryotic-like serine/threonine-protein kinase